MRKSKANEQHKDRLFKRVFDTNEELLNLYNAVNGTDYDNAEDLEINTLEDAIYMGMKNDTSFIIRDILNLYEHQSTFNPNMPLRCLFYISSLYKGIVGDNTDIYSSSLIKLPLPRCVVFYNGIKDEPEKRILKLSDSFQGTGEACLELSVTMLNINMGNNKELMKKCRRLYEYSRFIAEIRTNQNAGMNFVDAYNTAVDTCIKNDVLVDILRKNRGEIMDSILTEYNEQLHIDNEKELSHEEGRKEGLSIGESIGEIKSEVSQVRKKLNRGLDADIIAAEIERDSNYVQIIISEILINPESTDEDIAHKILSTLC